MAANPRAAAVAALVRQEQDGFSNLVLDAELRRQKLEGPDKAFAGAIFYTVLEHQGTLDFILEQFLPKGLARLDPQVREILRAAGAGPVYAGAGVGGGERGCQADPHLQKGECIRAGQCRPAQGLQL